MEEMTVSIEWYRDLSVCVLAFVTVGMLIFCAIITYSLYRKVKSTLVIIRETSESLHEIVSEMKGGIKILAVIKGARCAFEVISKMLKKESDIGGNSNE
jgi:uncharacterized membrane protein